MRINQLLLLPIAVAALLTSGCGSLRATLSVLDPEVIEAEKEKYLLRDRLPYFVGLDPTALENKILDLRNKHFAFYQNLAYVYTVEADELNGTPEGDALVEIAQSLTNDYSMAFDTYFNEAQNGLNKTFTSIRDRARRLQEFDQDQYPDRYRALQSETTQLIRQFDLQRSELASFVANDIGANIEMLGVNIQDSADTLDHNLSERTTIFIGEAKRLAVEVTPTPVRDHLLDDPYAFAVANAPEEAWADRYNSVIGRGKLGNVNVAVKLRPDLNFTLKGMTFDPSDVAVVASKVGTQTLLLAAQIVGVPTGQLSEGSADVPALSTSSRELLELQDQLSRAQARDVDFEEALIAFASAVVQERNRIDDSSTEAERARAIAAIRVSFKANSPRLESTEQE